MSHQVVCATHTESVCVAKWEIPINDDIPGRWAWKCELRCCVSPTTSCNIKNTSCDWVICYIYFVYPVCCRKCGSESGLIKVFSQGCECPYLVYQWDIESVDKVRWYLCLDRGWARYAERVDIPSKKVPIYRYFPGSSINKRKFSTCVCSDASSSFQDTSGNRVVRSVDYSEQICHRYISGKSSRVVIFSHGSNSLLLERIHKSVGKVHWIHGLYTRSAS